MACGSGSTADATDRSPSAQEIVVVVFHFLVVVFLLHRA